MGRLIFVRVCESLIALLVLSVIVFVLARATGNPVDLFLPADATREDIAAMTKYLGLDKPLYEQYWGFLSRAIRGNLGESLFARRPVLELIADRLPNSLSLAGVSMLFAVLLAFPLAVMAAVKKGTSVDSLANVIAVLGQSMPMFWLGIVLMQIFAVHLRWLPSSGMGGPAHYILPAFTMGWFVVAGMMRLLRSSMLDALDGEYVKLARIKGVSETGVIWKHALRNSLIPVVSFGGMYFAVLVTMAIVIETVFAWPGVGRLTYRAIVTRDFPVIQAVILTAAALIIFVNLIVDITYAYLDPRIRYR